MDNIAIFLSGGIGSRVGGSTPKQYIDVKGKPIFAYSLETMVSSEQFSHFQIVAENEYKSLYEKFFQGRANFSFSKPGSNRQLSILNALSDIKDIAAEDSKVFIHDAARPNLSNQMIIACLDELKNHDGVIPVLPMKDTIYQLSNNRQITGLIDRESVFAGQAPEAFLFGKYYRANLDLPMDVLLSIHGSSEPAIMAGMDIVTISGDEENYKITTHSDLDKFIKELD